MKRLVCAVLSALFVLLGATQANLAFAGLVTIASQSSPQAISSGRPVVFPAASSTTSNLASYTLPTFTAVGSCVSGFTLETSASTPPGSTVIKLTTAPPAYTVGMTAARTGIPSNTKVTAISAVVPYSITISNATTATINIGRNVTFTGCPYQQYFSINNTGNMAVTSIGIAQTVTVSSTDTMALQWCTTGWTNEASATCAGSINTIMTTSGTTGSQYVNASIPIAATNGTARIRAFTNVSGKTTTINIIMSTALNLAQETTHL